MAELVSRGAVEMTIIDLTDNRRLISYISADKQRQVIYDPDSSSYTPNYSYDPITLTPHLRVEGRTDDVVGQASSVKWFVQANSIEPLQEISKSNATYTLGTAVKTLTIKENVLALNLSMKYYCEVTYTDNRTNESYVTQAEFELIRLTNGSSGSNAITAILTNDTQMIQTDSDGIGGSYEEAYSSIMIFDGSINVTGNWNISIRKVGDITGELTGSKYKVESMASDSGKVIFVATRGDKTIEKAFSLIKVKNGRVTQLTRLSTDTTVVRKLKNGTYLPEAIKMRYQIKEGVKEWINQRVYYRILETLDYTNYTTRSESDRALTDYVYTPSSEVSAIKLEVYDANPTTDTTAKLLDNQLVQVVVDGKETVIPIITTPDGIMLSGSTESVRAELVIYAGQETVSADSYQWYKLDPSSPGDSNSGNGWRILNDINRGLHTTGYNSRTLTVTSAAVNGSETYLCIAFYGDQKLTATISIYDYQDTYSVVVLGSGVFRNGTGTNKYVAKVYRRGLEIDETGSYKYTWHLYDSSNNLNAEFRKSGKTIRVAASEVTNMALLTCTVEDK